MGTRGPGREHLHRPPDAGARWHPESPLPPAAHRVRRAPMPREGMLPQVDGSHHAWIEERGPRFALLLAADHARRIDPTPAARYQRLMVLAGKRHNSALCHVATTLLTRVVACWRRGEHYVIRDCDGQPISVDEGRSIVAERYSVPAEVRRQRLGSRVSTRKETGRRGQESHSAPAPARPLPALQSLVGA